MMLTKLQALAAALMLGGGCRAEPSDPTTKSGRPAKAVSAKGGNLVVDGIPADDRGGEKETTVVPNPLCIVNVYSTNDRVNRDFLFNFATHNILPEIKRTRGIGSATILGNRVCYVRLLLNPDRTRAYNLSSEDYRKALTEQGMIPVFPRLGNDGTRKAFVFTYIGRFSKPDQYTNIILKTDHNGQILRLKDLGGVELSPQFLLDIDSVVDGHPSVAIVLKQTPGLGAAVAIEEVKRKLEQIKEESFQRGMNFEVTPLLAVSKDQGMIYAVIQTPPGCTLEYTSDKSYDVQAFAKGIEGITSVSSLVGYEVLTESWGSNMGTCLIKLKPWSQLKLTARQIIEMLEEKCRQIPHVKLQFYEPPAVRGLGAASAIVPDQAPADAQAQPLEGATDVAGRARRGR
jgi:multidrug efflux pump subunit AcrB